MYPAITTIITAIIIAIMTTTTPATILVKQVEALKHGGRDSGEPAIADLKTGLRGGSGLGRTTTSYSTQPASDG